MEKDRQSQIEFDFIVLGAGIAGLGAAYDLKKKGYKVAVLEKDSQVGGRIKMASSAKFPIDTGAQFFASEYKEVIKLIRELKLESEIVYASPYAATIRNSKLAVINKNNPLSLLTSGTLGFKSMAKLALLMMKLRKSFNSITPEVIAEWVEFDATDAHEWSEAQLGAEAVDYLVEPFISGFTYNDPKLSSSYLATRMLAHFNKGTDIFGLRSGLTALPLALAKTVELYLNHEALEVSEEPDHISVKTNERFFRAKKLVCALPANHAKNLLREHFVTTNELLLSTTYATTMHMAFELPRELPSSMKSIYGMMIGKRESSLINVISLENNKHLERGTASNLVTVMLTSAGGLKLKNMTDQAAIQVVKNELERLLPELKNYLKDIELTRWVQAIPNQRPGHVGSVAEYRESLSPEQSIFLAGDYLGTPCVEGALESGLYISRLF